MAGHLKRGGKGRPLEILGQERSGFRQKAPARKGRTLTPSQRLKLCPAGPMLLHAKVCGRVGRCRYFFASHVRCGAGALARQQQAAQSGLASSSLWHMDMETAEFEGDTALPGDSSRRRGRPRHIRKS